MSGKTFAEKILGATTGSIVFKKPDIVLTHDNTASIAGIFKKMGGDKVNIDFAKGEIYIGKNTYKFAPLPEKLMEIFNAKGLVNYVKSRS